MNTIKILYTLVPISFFISCSPHKSYEITNSFKSKSFDGKLTQLIHKKSGAKLVLIKNKDQARSFMITFKTPPYDDTGLFHIFEHAVLAGSRLYPSKSNFFNVASSSVASYINASTSSISTHYPFTTRDPKDFDNLLSVYMDAVFFPKVIEEPKIVKREGWRYEIHPETKKMSINGVVFNEMKGAFSSPYKALWFHLNRALLPQTPYNYSSGGLPEKIAGLQFEQIVSAHKKYYRPQNAIICLYGDINFRKTLDTIDRNFLSRFNKNEDLTELKIPSQKKFNDKKIPLIQASYPSPKGTNKDFIVKGYLLGKLSPLEEDAKSVMLNAFASNNIAPLKLRVLKEGAAKSVSHMNLSGKDNAVAFVFEGTEELKSKIIEDIFQEELNKVIQQGLDEELLTSIINNVEFSYKEEGNNAYKGLYLSGLITTHWLYPDQPLKQKLDFITRFKEVRNFFANKERVKTFFQKHFKENQSILQLVMKPDPQFSKKFHESIKEQIETALKDKPLSEYEKEDKIYRKWVAAKEEPEITKKTPLLKVSDLQAEEKSIPFKKSKTTFYDVIEYPQPSNGISYIKLFFDLKGVEENNIKNIALFTSLLKKTDTKNYPFQKLSKQISSYMGGIGIGASVYQSSKNVKKYKPMMVVNLSFLNENLEKSMNLLKEVLVQSQFSPKDRVQSLLDELKKRMSNTASHRALHLSGLSAKKSFFPMMGSFNDEMKGGRFEEYILKEKQSAHRLIPIFKTLLNNIFNQNRLKLITITADQKQLPILKNRIKTFTKGLPTEGAKDQKWSFSRQKSYEGYSIPGEVQYVTEVASFKKQKLEYSGSLAVYSQYLDSHFMHPRLREQAGAYGAWNSFSRNGLWTLQTYRDPNLKKSFDIFSESVDFMKNETFNMEKLKPAIIGSLKSFYKDRSVSGKTGLITTLYLSDLNWEDYMKTKREILETKPENFQKINQVLSLALKESRKAVSGNHEKIKKEAPFLKKVLPID